MQVSQPNSFGKGDTTVVPQQTVRAEEERAHHLSMGQGATVEELVHGLQVLGATPRDVIAILQSLRAAGALQAEVQVL